MHYLIDGYNLLHATGHLVGKVSPARLERARLALLDHIVANLGPEADHATVVFDARRAPRRDCRRGESSWRPRFERPRNGGGRSDRSADTHASDTAQTDGGLAGSPTSGGRSSAALSDAGVCRFLRGHRLAAPPGTCPGCREAAGSQQGGRGGVVAGVWRETGRPIADR